MAQQEEKKDMLLFWGSGSAPCWKPMIALHEKGLWGRVDSKLCEFSKKEHKGEEVLKLNPRGQLPTFKHESVVVNESNAICFYLEDKFPDKAKLLPSDVGKKAECYQRCFESANLQSNVMMEIYYKMRTKKEDWDQEKIKEGYAKANDELKHWEKYLENKTYLIGDDFTMADVFFYPFLATVVRQGADIGKKYPNLKKYYDTCSKRPSIEESLPPHWKDSPSPNMLQGLCD